MIAIIRKAIGNSRMKMTRSKVPKYTRTQRRFEDMIVLTIVHAVRRYYTKYTRFTVKTSDKSKMRRIL